MADEEEMLTKLTVLLIPAADAALIAGADREGLSRTDALNRALIMYDEITAEMSKQKTREVRVGNAVWNLKDVRL